MAELSFRVSRKMKAIEQQAADAQARCAAMVERRKILENDAVVIETERKSQPEDQRANYDKALTLIAKEISEWDEEMKRRQERLINDAAMRGHCQEWLRLVPMNCELVETQVPHVEGEAGELLEVRSQILSVKRERAELATAPAASAELRAMVRDYVERMASRHTPRIRVAGGGMYIDWQSVDVLGVPEAPFGVLC
jgi:hypothetical protein